MLDGKLFRRLQPTDEVVFMNERREALVGIRTDGDPEHAPTESHGLSCRGAPSVQLV